MGLLTTLLFGPIVGPLQGALWAAEEIAKLAQDTYYDPTTVRAELQALERKLDAGEIGEAEFEEVEAALIQRLKEIQARTAEEA